MPLIEGLGAVWSEAAILLDRSIGSEPGLRGELPAAGALMPLLEGLALERFGAKRQE